jgi:F-type H+-transporting ATPase subunit delta
MENSKLAKRYARALFQVGVEENILQAIYIDMSKLKNLLADSKDLQALFKSPIIKSKTKQNLIKLIFDGKLNTTVINFLLFIIKAKREKYTSNITEQFDAIYKDYKGIKTANVITVSKIDAETKSQILSKLKEYTNSEIELSEEIDKNLIGGMQLFIDGKKYDNSLRAKLNKLRIELIEN